jgi:peptide/nickel transport system substrate-binding protein
MRRWWWALSTALALAAGAAQAQGGKEFRFAFQSDVTSLDPYVLNEAFNLGVLGNVYEGLTRRSPTLTIEPSLATAWRVIEPTRWRFELRRDVTFQDGRPFTAADVVFSANRVRAETSDLRTRIASVAETVAVDDYTIDFVLRGPNPILPFEWDTW